MSIHAHQGAPDQALAPTGCAAGRNGASKGRLLREWPSSAQEDGASAREQSSAAEADATCWVNEHLRGTRVPVAAVSENHQDGISVPDLVYRPPDRG